MNNSCGWGGWLELVWVRFEESWLSMAELARDQPITAYQVVDSGVGNLSYRTSHAFATFADVPRSIGRGGVCVRRRFLANRGRETPAYLSYIIERYESLPHWVVFVHGQPHAKPVQLEQAAACLLPTQPRSWDANVAPDFLPLVPTQYVDHRAILQQYRPGLDVLWRMWRNADTLPLLTKHSRGTVDDVATVSFPCCAQFLTSQIQICGVCALASARKKCLQKHKKR